MPKVEREILPVDLTFEEIRKARGISMAYAAERIGLTYMSMYNKEKGTTPFQFHEAQKLAKIYNYPLAKVKNNYTKVKYGNCNKLKHKLERIKKGDGRIKKCNS